MHERSGMQHRVCTARGVARSKPPTPRGSEQPNRTSNGTRRRIAKAAEELGRLGGIKGGRARAAKLTVAERRAIASKAAAARWKKQREQ